MEENPTLVERSTSRRSFLLGGVAAGAEALSAGRLLTDASPARAAGGLTPGDAAIVRFLAALETLETDLWQQYNELGGIQDSEVPGGSGNADYTAALAVLDADMAPSSRVGQVGRQITSQESGVVLGRRADAYPRAVVTGCGLVPAAGDRPTRAGTLGALPSFGAARSTKR